VQKLRFDKVTESLKMGTFLRHSVVGHRDPAWIPPEPLHHITIMQL